LASNVRVTLEPKAKEFSTPSLVDAVDFPDEPYYTSPKTRMMGLSNSEDFVILA